jgi:ATP-dependent RNA helicase DDX47/RRP3
MVDQAIALSKKPHVIVATPGRLVDHLKHTKGFNLKGLKILIMDEADRILNLDFGKELDIILKVIPEKRQTLLFSATMTDKVEKLQKASLRNPVKVHVSTKYSTVDKLIQNYIFLPFSYKECYLAYLMNEIAGNSCIVFTATCSATQRLTLMLRELGFPAVALHGQMPQPKRLGALAKFSSGSRSILLATDVASRGLDLPCVDYVINYDLPTSSKTYVHRVGRTARAGRSGKSVTFVSQYDVEMFQRLENLLGKKMEAFPVEKQKALALLDRVSEANRIANMVIFI